MMIVGKKIRTLALLSAGTLMLSPTGAQAGFEFLPSTGEQAAAAPAQPQAAPMPIAPIAPAADTGGMSPMPVLPSIPVTAQPLPPMDLGAPAPTAAPVPSPAQSGALVINPYPLQASNVDVTHNSSNVYVEQAMMQEAGALRGIAAPGANYSSQITNNAQNISLIKAPPVYPQGPVSAPTSYGLSPEPPVQAVPVAPPAMPQPAPVVPTAGYSEAVGFGKELPLALALSQVVPSDYSFSFGQNVNVGSTVSWQGGKSWDAVLQDMLAPVGMKAVITGKQVIIQNAA